MVEGTGCARGFLQLIYISQPLPHPISSVSTNHLMFANAPPIIGGHLFGKKILRPLICMLNDD